MKLKYTLLFTIITFFITITGFSQQYSDQEIGFDVERITNTLKKHGVKEGDIQHKMSELRETYVAKYLSIKETQSATLQDNKSKSLKDNKSHTARTALTTTISPSEKDALIALYNSTGGTNWVNQSGWDRITDPTFDFTNLYGVTVVNGTIINLILPYNNLTGSLPEEIGQFSNLKRLILPGNNLTGLIPTQIGDLKDLESLTLFGNKLSGSIPSQIGNLGVKLVEANFSNNLISGIPTEIGQLKALKFLYLYDNQITSLPSEIGGLSSLEVLELSTNKITGILPPQIGALKKLRSLAARSNQLSGSIPREIGEMESLQTLDLTSNKLTGIIPTEIEKLVNMTELNLSSNELTGPIPEQIGFLTRLEILSLEQNFLTGPIPSQIGSLKALRNFSVSNNKLSETLPTVINTLPKLYMLKIGYNKFSGNIPNLTNLTTLKILDISVNKFRFADFAMQYSTYKNMLTTFNYNNQDYVNEEKTITTPAGKAVTLKMYDDNRFADGEVYQWYKSQPGGGYTEISQATSREYTITNPMERDALTYYCTSTLAGIPDLKLFTNLTHLNITTTCNSTITGSIKANPENITLLSVGNFKLETTATNLTYSWTVTYPDNSKSEANKLPEFSHHFQQGPGLYIISLKVKDANGCEQTFEKQYTLNYDCSTNPISGKIVNLSSGGNFDNTQVLVNASTEFSFYSWGNDFSDKKFTWKLINSNKDSIAGGSTQNFSFNAAILGNYILKLKVSDVRIGCGYDFSKDITVVNACTYTDGERYGTIDFEGEYNRGALAININETKNLDYRFSMYREQRPEYNYNWKLYSPDSTFIREGTQRTFPLTLSTGGFHKMIITVKDPVTGCETEITKSINGLIPNSCTNTNPKSQMIKGLYLDLVKNLIARSIMGESDADINASPPSPQFTALKPYITNGPKDKIYHYKTTRIKQNEGSEDNSLVGIEFSFSPDQVSTNRVSFGYTIYYNPEYHTYEDLLQKIDYVLYLDIEQYTASNTPLISCQVDNISRNQLQTPIRPVPGECDRETTVQNIDFCPAKECTPIVGTLKFVNTSTPAPVEKKTTKSASKI